MASSSANKQRRYNQWAANESMEDYALRYTANKARRWSSFQVANTALGIVSFLALEAIGGAITLNYGFSNAFAAISCVCILIFLFGLPICYFAAKEGIDIDLLTRGAGFGYLGSTFSSLIYASFTFIFFALEAAIMSMALKLCLGLDLAWGYIVSALIIIPLVTHGIGRIRVLQLYSQPLWLLLQFLPLIYIVSHEGFELENWLSFSGAKQSAQEFNLLLFGAAAAVIFPLMAQNAEQADFLRFLPKPNNAKQKRSWWAAVVMAGPGWVVMGFVKLLIGSLLAVLLLQAGFSMELADDPSHMYYHAFSYLSSNQGVVMALVLFFVVISQIKINVTNAYAGSIAWSNFFSRLTHHHPGRVVWLVFNVLIALLLMELGLYHAFESILLTFSALVLAWVGSLVADLVINRSLGLRPKKIAFKRSELYDLNPVGVVSMVMASSLGICAQQGLFGDLAQAFAPFMALFLPFIIAPLVAYLTQGRYYLVAAQAQAITQAEQCCACEQSFDGADMSYCPFYSKPICSLCCSLEAPCQNQCRPKAHIRAQLQHLWQRLLGRKQTPENYLLSYLLEYGIIYCLVNLLLALVFYLVYISMNTDPSFSGGVNKTLLIKLYCLLLIVNGILVWLYVLAKRSLKIAFSDSYQQTLLLQQEVLAHQNTESQLQQAKEQADAANQAKTRYLSGVSHELRNPLNTVYGYAQLLAADQKLDNKTRQSADLIVKNGEHITDIIEGLLEISKIEARRVDFLHKQVFAFNSLLKPLIDSFALQAQSKGIGFSCEYLSDVPAYINSDLKRVRQVLINLLGNAIKFTAQGEVKLSISYRNQVAKFVISDTGPGIAAGDIEAIFDPFQRGSSNQQQAVAGTGLGLSISRLLAELLGGQISVNSEPGKGSEFSFNVMLPSVSQAQEQVADKALISAYQGVAKTILVVDDQAEQRQLLQQFLTPLGFEVLLAENAEQALLLMAEYKIDLAILDVSMPEVDGWQLAEQARALSYAWPIIMLSGNAIESQPQALASAWHQAYLLKPVAFEQLLDCLANLLKLTWLSQPRAQLEVANTANLVAKPDTVTTAPEVEQQLQQLLDYSRVGYAKGVEQILMSELLQLSANEGLRSLNQKLESLLCAFDFSAMTTELETYLAAEA